MNKLARIQTFDQNQTQLQRLLMLPQMQQALHILQMPVMELLPLVEMQLEENPIVSCDEDDEDENEECEDEDEKDDSEKELEFSDNDLEILKKLDADFRDAISEKSNFSGAEDAKEKQDYLEQSITKNSSLFEHLMQQANENFHSENDLQIAELLIGNLNEAGFLDTSFEELEELYGWSERKLRKTLSIIQTFNPSGIAATDLKESLLIQLKQQKERNELAIAIIEKHYEDLLHNRIPEIAKSLDCSANEVKNAIKQHILRLNLHPASAFSQHPVQHAIPDVTVTNEGDEWFITINDDYMPTLRLNSRYMRLLENPDTTIETKEYIVQKLSSLKWLLKNIYHRNDNLEKIIRSLLKRQSEYFASAEGKLNPLTMKTVADEIGVHESTIARTVANKYLECPRGIVSLRHFFTNAYNTESGQEISSNTVRDALDRLIKNENKRKPLSDEALSTQLKQQGIPCARRTIAKYRNEMHHGNAHQRKQF